MPRFQRKNKSGTAALILALTLGLAACGIKPGDLTPPSGKNAPEFPATYPKAPDSRATP